QIIISMHQSSYLLICLKKTIIRFEIGISQSVVDIQLLKIMIWMIIIDYKNISRAKLRIGLTKVIILPMP
ncbi:MAG: hypothetical protein QN423_10935, partial [Nitrososphaeraceae archaeon]|nr:hypothetical protein [Nitrososphaeraceae archaeon]